MFNKKWAKDTLERVLSTTAQSILVYVGGDVLNAWDFDWKNALGIAAGSALLTFLKCVAASKVGDENSASLAN